MIEIQLNFAPIHEHPIGWNEGGTFSEPSFPYGASLEPYDSAGNASQETQESSAPSENSTTAERAEVEAENSQINGKPR